MLTDHSLPILGTHVADEIALPADRSFLVFFRKRDMADIAGSKDIVRNLPS